MLIQFAVKNFKTFKEQAVLKLVATNYDKETRVEENIVYEDKHKLKILKSAVIYGANASGKSKFMEALMFMRRFAITSSKDSQKGDKIPVEPFRLSVESEKEPSEFEVIFNVDDALYRYGFEVDKNQVISEWLYHKPNTKEIELFYRDRDTFETHPRNFKRGKVAVKEGLVRDNALLLSLAGQLNDPNAIIVIEWFRNLRTLSGLQEDGYQGFTMARAKEPDFKVKILELLRAADLGIQDIKLEFMDLEKLSNDLPRELVERLRLESLDENVEIISDTLTWHKRYDKDQKYVDNVSFSLEDDESSGTRKFFALTGPVLDVLANGDVLVVDELDSKLHPNLVCKIVSLFNSKEANPKNAQLIFNTHDTNLLSSGLFRRDQVWFTEKDKYGAGHLYSLADFKSTEVRKEEPFEENYIRGKYGAIPFLGFFDRLMATE